MIKTSRSTSECRAKAITLRRYQRQTVIRSTASGGGQNKAPMGHEEAERDPRLDSAQRSRVSPPDIPPGAQTKAQDCQPGFRWRRAPESDEADFYGAFFERSANSASASSSISVTS
jgi:hypothetical protein